VFVLFHTKFHLLYRVVTGVDNLECMALQLQTLLRMYRLDLAKKLCAKMQEKDDDATLTQLCQAWLNMQIGGEKLQDAYYIFQDFCDKFSPSAMLLNSQAACFIGQQKYEEAEAVLRDCLDKDSNNYDALVNLIVLSQTTEKQTDNSASVSNKNVLISD
jgi:coatomer subunit epsilon